MSSNSTIFTGGSATTTFPYWMIQPSTATASTLWNTAGTFFGVNSAASFTGLFLDFHVNNAATVFKVSSSGATTAATFVNNANIFGVGTTAATAVQIGSASILGWSTNVAYNGGNVVGLDESAAGILEVNLGTAQGSGGALKTAGIISGGTAFTVSGCGTAAAVTGGASAGSFTVGTGATNCTFTVTLNGATGLTAPHGWVADADDTTANIHCVNSTTVSTTTVVFVCTGTIATSDLIKFLAVAY